MVWSATSSMKVSGTLVTGMFRAVAAANVDAVGADATERDYLAVFKTIDDGLRDSVAACDERVTLLSLLDKLALARGFYLHNLGVDRGQVFHLRFVCALAQRIRNI